MPKSVQSTYSNTNTPQYEHHVFSRQARINSEQQLSTPALVPTAQRTETVGLTAGSPRTYPLDADLIGTSRYYARQPAKPTGERHDQPRPQQPRVNGGQGSGPNTASTHKRHSTPDRQHALHKEEGVPHQQRDVFSTDEPRGTAERPLQGVWQDKARIKNARQASLQTAPVTKVTRAEYPNNHVVRSHNVSGARQKSGRVTLWGLDPALKAELERIALKEGLSISATGVAFLRKSLQQNVDLEYTAVLQPIIERAIAGYFNPPCLASGARSPLTQVKREAWSPTS